MPHKFVQLGRLSMAENSLIAMWRIQVGDFTLAMTKSKNSRFFWGR
jgi:hypothetical protein